MPRKSKQAAILEQLEADESVDLDALREIAQGFARVLWFAAHSDDIADAENEAITLAERIAVYAAE